MVQNIEDEKDAIPSHYRYKKVVVKAILKKIDTYKVPTKVGQRNYVVEAFGLKKVLMEETKMALENVIEDAT